MNTLIPSDSLAVVVHAPGGVSMTVHPVISNAGTRAAKTTLEWFAAHIPNPNTRKSYARTVGHFCSWCSAHGVGLLDLEPPTIAAYLEELKAERKSLATIKLVAAGLRGWLDFLTVRGVIPSNPALSVRTPRLVVREGKTPIFEGKNEARDLFASLKGGTLLELRDRALFAVMLYPPFARVSAAVGMRVKDFEDGKAPFIVLHEKGGLDRREPCHHKTAEFLRAYLDAAGTLREQPDAPLFQSAPRRSKGLSGKTMRPGAAWEAVKRRCKDAELSERITCHSFRAAGITYHREAGGDIRITQRLAGHASLNTTAGYDRSSPEEGRAEVERVQL